MSLQAASRQRVALGVEYEGSAYCGWQIQVGEPSIQAELGQALSRVAAEPVTCIAAGRTDAGVHASGQVVHFDTTAIRRPFAWVAGVNSHLPTDIAVQWACPVSDSFHARFSAVARSYRYSIINRPARPALSAGQGWWVRTPLDASAMHRAAQALVGEHDFSAFRAAACQAAGPVRRITRLTVERAGEWIHIDCRANAFLHHMMRNIVGSLVQVGRGEFSDDRMAALLHGRDRRLAGMTAPPAGLTLTRVEYPAALLPAIERSLVTA